jgi:hypothetical protein
MTVTEQSTDRERRVVYIIAAVFVGLLLVVSLLSYRSKESSQAAEQKANQLIAALQKAGAHPPTQDQIVRVLGDDGGAVCDDPSGALRKAILLGQIMNGAAGPGMRPVIGDNRVVRGELLVIGIYCPDELPRFQEFVNNLKFDDTVKG